MGVKILHLIRWTRVGTKPISTWPERPDAPSGPTGTYGRLHERLGPCSKDFDIRLSPVSDNRAPHAGHILPRGATTPRWWYREKWKMLSDTWSFVSRSVSIDLRCSTLLGVGLNCPKSTRNTDSRRVFRFPRCDRRLVNSCRGYSIIARRSEQQFDLAQARYPTQVTWASRPRDKQRTIYSLIANCLSRLRKLGRSGALRAAAGGWAERRAAASRRRC